MSSVTLLAQNNDAVAFAAIACVGVVGLVVYFLPTGIAALRFHKNGAAIFILNLLLGWTFIGWVVALVWSFTSDS